MDLTAFDGPVATGGERVPAWLESGRPPAIPNGFYTLTFPDGSHRTFRIHTQNPDAKFAPGRRIFSLLIGPQNTTDFEKVGWVEEDGIKIWKRHQGAKVTEYARLVWMLATGCEADGYELTVSKRCLCCNRELTTPESLERGIGPLCWERIHG